MPESSVADFEKNLRLSGGLTEAQIASFDFGEFTDVRYLAKRLVDQKLLTEWQAKLLLSGRHQMKVGGYLLLERLERNELGDRYQARHQSLDRLVELQFLPKEFGRTSPQFEPFVKSARMLTEIDHPNLAHVYDIGEEGGRYYVVQESVNGQPLSAFDFSAIGETQALKLIREMASVVRFLHDKKILHGSINKETVFINRTGQCQLNGLITKILEERVLGRRDELAARQEALQFGLIDRVAIQGLTGELLEKSLGKNADPALFSAIVQLGQNTDSLGKIESLTNRLLQQQNEIKPARNALEPPTNATREPATKPKKPTASMSTAPQTTVQVWKVFAGIGAALIVLSGVIVWGFWSGAFFGTNRTSIAKESSKTKVATQQPDTGNETSKNSSSKKSNARSSRKQSDEAKSETKTTDSAESMVKEDVKDNSVGADNNPSPVNPDAAASAPTDNSNANPTKSNNTPPISNDDFAAQLLSNNETKPDLEKSAADKGQSSPPPRDGQQEKSNDKSPRTQAKQSGSTAKSNDPFDAPGVVSQKTTPEKMPAGKGEAALASAVPAAASGPVSLASIPSSFELQPPDGSGMPQTLGALAVSAVDDIVFDLISDPERCGKGKNHFQVKPSKSKPEWGITFSTKADDPEAKLVGKFFVKEQQLMFAWEKDVEPKSNANYLANCCLQLTTDKENKVVPLRKSIPIEVALNDKTFTFKDSLDIPWLPADGVKVEFGTLNPTQFGEGRIDNPQMANKMPATISFTELATERVFWIAVSAEFKNKADLRVEVQTTNDRGPIILSPKSLTEVMEALQAMNAQLVMDNNVAQEILGKTPPGTTGIGKKRDDAKAAEKKMKDAQVFRAKAVEQAELVRNLVGVPIPLRVVYEFQNQKIELARTSNFSTEPPPAPAAKTKR